MNEGRKRPFSKPWPTLVPSSTQTAPHHVNVSPEYTLKYGRPGTLLDRLFVYPTYKKGIGSLLQGLKQFVQAC
ncbi:MAG: hypothetical protein KDE56_13395 [Anaerolineales bacterium]|nr:hypothetical protein [Anaerolineales bacterium]